MRFCELRFLMLVLLVTATSVRAAEAVSGDAMPVEPAAPESPVSQAAGNAEETGDQDADVHADMDEEKDRGKNDAAAASEPTIDERLDALMSEVSTYEDREVVRCLNLRSYRKVKTLNTDYLLFSRGSVFWLNKLKRTCHSLKFNDLPIFESRGVSRLCEGDPFYPTNSMDLQMGLDASGRPRAIHGTCYLGSFESITAEQAALLTGQD
jgi:hypothetical protein